MSSRTKLWNRATQPIAALLFVVLIFGGAALLTTTSARAQANLSDTGRYTFSDLAEKVLPSIVTVYVKRDISDQISAREREQFDQFRRLFPGLIPDFPGFPNEGEDGPFMIPSSGSGIIISEDGYILTNAHVIGRKGDNVELRVVLSNDEEIGNEDIQVIESHELTDLALIKVDRDNLVPIEWGDSDKLRIGERVAAIGSPLDLRATITQGIICANHREVGPGIVDMIQTDAVINPGSSGGALVNLDGELVGVNRLITTNTGGWQGYGFAIPSNDARQFVETVQKEGEYASGFIGITMAGAAKNNEQMRRALELDPEMKGVLVEAVRHEEPHPALDAGLQTGDFIIEADGQPVQDNMDLLKIVARKKVGSRLELKFRRLENGKSREMKTTLTIARRPAEDVLMAETNPSFVPRSETLEKSSDLGSRLGMVLEPAEDGDGLRVRDVRPGSPAQVAGIKNGDIIRKVNGQTVRSADELKKIIEAAKEGAPLAVMLEQEGRMTLTVIQLDKASD
ncbi:MAG TPA: trypsin-like peptidase domain-containing protein [Candidatus Sumerlaeota bacterium]|nr:trypsin-like peptidase domain-containing protein [Candidatus Sumerlaeota bacterium]HOR27467.1 trypsin-like peptidase domain-containing protein [Candidatus Sumerlaeota bacterium]